MYRNANVNDLISRYEVPANDSDFDASENVRYARSSQQQPSHIRRVHGGGVDENRTIMKFGAGQVNETFFLRRSTVTMSGVKEFVKQLLQRISMLLEMISKFPFPRMSVVSFGLTSLLAIFIAPRAFTERVIYPGFKIIFTIIYPAYRSFKAVRNKNLKEYLKWIVYWIVYAFFTCMELIADALFNWFPFYYEIKVIFLIWLLGPSSRGSMKIYKSCIHPMLISREQEIDDIIQLAQEHGYMHVLRLSSTSVNYANKIIMQDSKSDSSFIVSHQLMRNISLSNMSDVGETTALHSSEDNEENSLRMRRFSAGKIPIYGNQLNYSYENLEHRRPSYDLNRFENMSMSSGYASPTPQYYQSPQSRAFIEDYGTEITQQQQQQQQYRNLTRTFSAPDESIPPEIVQRRTSLNELSEDEIVLAYNRLQMQKQQPPKEKIENTAKHDENYQEFLKWMEMKRTNEDIATVEKVKPSNDDESVDVAELKSEKTEIETSTNITTTTTTQHSDFDEFKDAIESDESLKVPLVIVEENEASALIPTVIEDNIISHEPSPSNSEASDSNVVNAKLMLSNEPLQIVTNLSQSSMSLASIKSTDESGNKKRPATHKKGPAPPPPPPGSSSATSSDVNVEGFFFHKLTKKLFKETEL